MCELTESEWKRPLAFVTKLVATGPLLYHGWLVVCPSDSLWEDHCHDLQLHVVTRALLRFTR